MSRNAPKSSIAGNVRKARPETNLVVLPIKNILNANKKFGLKTNSNNTPIILKPAPRSGIRMIIPHGFDSIVTENGKVLGVFKPGLYYRSAFFQVANLVNTQHIPYHFAISNCPTRDNIHISVEVDFLFHVTNSVKFVYQIGPENMENLLRATQAEAVRSLVRSVHSSEAYDLRGTDSEDMLTALNDKMNEFGITVDQVTIANVTLPSDVALNMQNTTTFDAKQKQQMKKQELQMKVLDDAQFLKRVEQNRKNEIERAMENAKKSHKTVQNDIDELQSKLNKELESIKAQLNDQSAQIKAEADLDIGRINAERDKLVNEILGSAKVAAQKIRAESERNATKVRTETQLKVAEINSRIVEVQAEAEKYAAMKLKAKRDFEVETKRLQLLQSLAQNPNSIIAGDMEENPFAQLFVANKTAEIMGIKTIGSKKS